LGRLVIKINVIFVFYSIDIQHLQQVKPFIILAIHCITKRLEGNIHPAPFRGISEKRLMNLTNRSTNDICLSVKNKIMKYCSLLTNNREKFVNRMYEQGRKVFITGSNATMLSSEISSSLTGRNKVLELFPFSFSEYLRMEDKAYYIERLSVRQRALLLNDFNAYLETGGFPLVVKEKDAEIAHALFQDILYRDILVRYKLTNVEEVRQIALYLASNTGKLFSYATLQTISGLKSLSSVKNYLQYFEASYLFYYLKKFDYSVKKQIMNSRKVFAVDNAIPNRLGFRFSDNKGRLLENVVFIELKRRGCELYYFSEKLECDFLVKENLLIIEAIQVTYSLNSDNYTREMGGLREAMQSFNIPKGTLIVFDDNKYPAELPEGVSVIQAYEWLLNTKRLSTKGPSLRSG
jgi:uncharacterized protein